MAGLTVCQGLLLTSECAILDQSEEITRRMLTQLGPYRVLRRLGEGGMACAYLGAGPDGRQVVLKVPLETSAEMTVKLRDEGQAGMRVRSPHVVETIDFFMDKGRAVLVLEFIDGCALRDLRQLQHRPNPLPPAAVAHLGRSLAEGLATIHEARDEEGRPLGMLHRDVTPPNILVGRDGNPKLIDLGIARSKENQQARTQVGMLKGTLRYVAPELLAGEGYSAASDLWSLGVCLFEAALGRMMVAGEPMAIFKAIMAGDYRNLRPGEVLDADLQAAIFALVTDANSRLRNARAAASVFGRLEERFIERDPGHHTGQAWLQTWVPYAQVNEDDVDGAPAQPSPDPAPARSSASSSLASSSSAPLAKAGTSPLVDRSQSGSAVVATRSTTTSTSSSTSRASSASGSQARVQADGRLVIGGVQGGTMPTMAMEASTIDPGAPSLSTPSSTASSPRGEPEGPGPTLVLPRVDIGPTMQLPAVDIRPPASAPRTNNPDRRPQGAGAAAHPPPAEAAPGDVLPAGAATVQMGAWQPPDIEVPPSPPRSSPRPSLVRPDAPDSAVAFATVQMPVASIPARSPLISDEGAAATLVMAAVDPKARDS